MPTYKVTWTTPGSDQAQTSRVETTPGYTTKDDIPRIIAVSRTGRPSDAVFIRVQKVEEA